MVKATQEIEKTSLMKLEEGLEQYAIVEVMEEADDFQQAMKDNIGDDGFSIFDLERIKMPTGGNLSWSIPDPDAPDGIRDEREIHCIILYWKDSRQYWPDEQGTVENTPPECQSDDGKIGYGTPGGICANCHFSQFGTGRNGTSQSQACKLTRNLFIVMSGDRWPLGLSIPPGSLKAVRAYFRQLLRYGKSFNQVETIISLEKVQNANKQTYSRAVFRKGRNLTTKERECVKQFAQGLMPLLDQVKPSVTEAEVEA